MNERSRLSASEMALFAEPWYHDFEVLGIKTPQIPGIYKPNQECKQEPLFSLIRKAISICRESGTSAKGVELFCADGFYSNFAVQNGAESMYGIDLNENYLTKARLITKLLGNTEKIVFQQKDVFDLNGRFDFGICAGGLYHLHNPHELLKLLTAKIGAALVIQTVYSLANPAPDYFETPAPGWQHGCRFSHDYLLRMVQDSGWEIKETSVNELKGNPLLQNRGSAYLLCIQK